MKHTKYLHIHDWNTGGAIIAAARTGIPSTGPNFLSPRTRLEKTPFFILTSITCLRSIR